MIELCETFAYLDFALTSLAIYRHTPTFDKVKLAVQSSSNRTFSEELFSQILYVFPEAFKVSRCSALDTKSSVNGHDILLIVKNHIRFANGPDNVNHATAASLRINQFRQKINLFLENEIIKIVESEDPALELSKEASLAKLVERLDRLLIPLAKLPPVQSLSENDRKKTKAREAAKKLLLEKNQSMITDVEKRQIIAKPISKEFIDVPVWLLNKVRFNELKNRKKIELLKSKSNCELVTTLSKLSDQLDGYSRFKRKNIFKLTELKQSLINAPCKSRLYEQLCLLEEKVPKWLKINKVGKEYVVRIQPEIKYCVVKANLRKFELSANCKRKYYKAT